MKHRSSNVVPQKALLTMHREVTNPGHPIPATLAVCEAASTGGQRRPPQGWPEQTHWRMQCWHRRPSAGRAAEAERPPTQGQLGAPGHHLPSLRRHTGARPQALCWPDHHQAPCLWESSFLLSFLQRVLFSNKEVQATFSSGSKLFIIPLSKYISLQQIGDLVRKPLLRLSVYFIVYEKSNINKLLVSLHFPEAAGTAGSPQHQVESGRSPRQGS